MKHKAPALRKHPAAFLAVLFLAIAPLIPVAAQEVATVDFWTDMPPAQLSETLTDSMSDEELLAQIFMFGWSGAEPSALLTDWVR